jgi:hypothetical protein
MTFYKYHFPILFHLNPLFTHIWLLNILVQFKHLFIYIFKLQIIWCKLLHFGMKLLWTDSMWLFMWNLNPFGVRYENPFGYTTKIPLGTLRKSLWVHYENPFGYTMKIPLGTLWKSLRGTHMPVEVQAIRGTLWTIIWELWIMVYRWNT